MTAPISVFIVDDHAGYRAVAAAVVDATDGFRLQGTAASAAEARRALLEVCPGPDLVLMDINLGDDSGIELTEAVTHRLAATKVVFVSALDLDELPETARGSGGSGFLPKGRLSPVTLHDAYTGAYDWPA